MTRTLSVWTLALVLLVSAAGCGSDSPTTPSGSDPVQSTEVFNSLVQKLGTTTRTFTTTSKGVITVSLTSMSEDAANVSLGLGLTDLNTGLCAPTYSVVTSLYAGRILSVTADPGSYCFLVSDVGEIVNQSTFTVVVTHF